MGNVAEFDVITRNNCEYFRLTRPIVFYSERYNKRVEVPIGFVSDGATGAVDIDSMSWWVHDWLTRADKTLFSDGSTVSNLQASMILRDILLDENRYIRAHTWFVATYFYRSITT